MQSGAKVVLDHPSTRQRLAVDRAVGRVAAPRMGPETEGALLGAARHVILT